MSIRDNILTLKPSILFIGLKWENANNDKIEKRIIILYFSVSEKFPYNNKTMTIEEYYNTT